MKNKRDKKIFEQKIVKCIIWLIIALIALMLIVVVRDRLAFHNKVYGIAISEINEQTKAYPDSAALDSFKRSSYHADTTKMSPQTAVSNSGARNHNDISQTVTINSCSDPIKQKAEDISSLIDKLKDTDGLISANGITFLISLVVALLISLVSDRVIAMEKLMREVQDLSTKTKQYIKGIATNSKIKNELQNELHQIKENNKVFYQHATNYNNVLNRISNLSNNAIIIENTLGSVGVNDATSKVIGVLCSRISLIYDGILDYFKNDQLRLAFLTSEEKKLLETNIDDTLLFLNKSLGLVPEKGHDALIRIIQDKIYLVKEIKDKIDTIEEREEIKN